MLALNFRGTLPGDSSNRYSLQANMEYQGHSLQTNTVFLPYEGSFQIGMGPGMSSMGVFVPKALLPALSTVGRGQPLDMRGFGVSFQVARSLGISPQRVRDAASSRLVLELVDTAEVWDKRRTIYGLAANREFSSPGRPRIAGYGADYVSPPKPRF